MKGGKMNHFYSSEEIQAALDYFKTLPENLKRPSQVIFVVENAITLLGNSEINSAKKLQEIKEKALIIQQRKNGYCCQNCGLTPRYGKKFSNEGAQYPAEWSYDKNAPADCAIPALVCEACNNQK